MRAPLDHLIRIKGAGEMASAVAWRLYRAHFGRIVMTDLEQPLCVRRTVSFCEALIDGMATVEGVTAQAARDETDIASIWRQDRIAVMPASLAHEEAPTPDILIDAVLAKRNLGTHLADAGLVIGLGPGFTAGIDCHVVIETNRGHELGRVLEHGSAQPNTGVPGDIAGHTQARVLRAPRLGVFLSERSIGDRVVKGETIGTVEGVPVPAELGGILRGLIRPGTLVEAGLKIGDIDPRAQPHYCRTISDKARAIAGAVLEAVLRHANRPR
ncbi:MAG: EF2563 family selenium-dependent molybdenum hydroxylase system protein [Rhodospirillales bacterium]|nr:EF2563 family selenium-dependent molybdenum hydroxylase system protein [Rhodospirillales bacterium]